MSSRYYLFLRQGTDYVNDHVTIRLANDYIINLSPVFYMQAMQICTDRTSDIIRLEYEYLSGSVRNDEDKRK